jgi:hypothetical protein
MPTLSVDPPRIGAGTVEWSQYVAQLEQLKRDEPGNKLVDMMLVMARTMHPGAQKANPYHHGAGDEQGGQFTTRDDSTLYFEAAPDPNDKELTQRWETLTPEEKQIVSNALVKDVTPVVLKELGVGGALEQVVGGYAGYTNPAYALQMDDEHVFDAAKLLGYSLGQDSMAIVSSHPLDGLDKVGVVAVTLPPADMNIKALQAHYENLGQLRDDNGEMLVSGFTADNGSMKILNFSSKSDAELAALVDKQLGGKYNVETASAYSTLVEKKDYLSAGNQATEGRTPSVWRQAADRIRQAASQAVNGELKRRGKAAAQRAEKAVKRIIKRVSQRK